MCRYDRWNRLKGSEEFAFLETAGRMASVDSKTDIRVLRRFLQSSESDIRKTHTIRANSNSEVVSDRCDYLIQRNEFFEFEEM